MEGHPRVIDELLPEGTELGRHRILGKLSEGAHAILYMGEHQFTRAEVAIKVLRAAQARSGEMMARFDREARVMGRLAGSPSIVQVHDAGELADGRRYLVMEFVRGRELSTLLTNCNRRGVPLELERVLTIARDIASALRDAHGKGVIHRDLKPSNVMVIREPDGREHAKLVDFGVSGDLEVVGTSADLTATGSVIGTPEYMSPEQAVGLPASVSMDIFALGVVMFEMTTGSLPPQQALRQGAVPRASALRPGVPAALDSLVHECLQVDPARRVSDAIEVLSRLGTAAEDLAGRADPNAWSQGRPVRAAGTLDVVPSGSMPAAVTVVAGAGPLLDAHAVPPPRPPSQPAAASAPGRGVLVAVVLVLGILVGLGAWLWLRDRAASSSAAVAVAAPQSAVGAVTTADTDAPPLAEPDAVSPVPAGADVAPRPAAPGPEVPEPAAPGHDAPGPEVPGPTVPVPAAPEDPPPSGPVLVPVPEPEPRPKPQPTKPAAEAPTPKPAATPAGDKPSAEAKGPECVAAREAAAAAGDSLDWRAVLEHTRKPACWPDKTARLRLRVESLAELSRHEACVTEGGASTDPAVVRTVGLCRRRLGGTP